MHLFVFGKSAPLPPLSSIFLIGVFPGPPLLSLQNSEALSFSMSIKEAPLKIVSRICLAIKNTAVSKIQSTYLKNVLFVCLMENTLYLKINRVLMLHVVHVLTL